MSQFFNCFDTFGLEVPVLAFDVMQRGASRALTWLSVCVAHAVYGGSLATLPRGVWDGDDSLCAASVPCVYPYPSEAELLATSSGLGIRCSVAWRFSRVSSEVTCR